MRTQKEHKRATEGERRKLFLCLKRFDTTAKAAQNDNIA
jgi:hypothetical protein